jgi:hypothetical protein
MESPKRNINYAKQTISSQSQRILPEYYSPRKTRLKEKALAKKHEEDLKEVLKIARDARMKHRQAVRSQKAAMKIQNVIEVEKLTSTTSAYMRKMLLGNPKNLSGIGD